MAKLLKMTDEEEELAYSPGTADLAPGKDARPLWMKQLHEASLHWLKLIPTVLIFIKE